MGVGKESYKQSLSDRLFIEAAWSSKQGVVEDFVVGLYRVRPKLMIARFDNLHGGGVFDGMVHMDLVDKNGCLRAKVPFARVSLRFAITYAKNYFQENAEALEAQFKFWG